MGSMQRGAYCIFIRCDILNSKFVGPSNYINFQNQFKCRSPLANIFSRSYKGSNRYKREKALKDKLRLQQELELEYGIPSRPEFNHNEWMKTNYFSEFKAFQARLNIKFNKHEILMSAFAHPTFLEELKLISHADLSYEETDMLRRFELKKEVSNIPFQKLSLLGYDITLLVVKSAIYQKYPNITSTICSDIAKFLTSRETITMIAKNLAIDELLLLSRELEESEDLNNEYHLKFTKEDILCDTFYSVVGAVEKDLGHAMAKDFVNVFLVALVDYEDLSDHTNLNHAHEELMKILALEGVQGKTRARTIIETGVNSHFPFYYAGIYCNGCKIGDGSGYSAYTARIDGFKNAIFSCLEGDVDFARLRKGVRRM